jgi:hypothetical protein
MMFKKIFITLLLLPLFCYGQNRGAGSARTLSGNIYILNVFVSEPGKPWKTGEKNTLLKKADKANLWLKKQAAKQGVSISFISETSNVDVVMPYIPDINDNSASDIIKTSLKLLGYSNNKKFHKWVNERHNVDSYLVAIMPNKSGRSYAPFLGSKDIEGFVLYKSYQGTQQWTSVIAHETLHAFGAWDLYVDPQLPPKINKKREAATKMWPTDIMADNPFNIERVQIGALTGWRVGIQPKGPGFDNYAP